MLTKFSVIKCQIKKKRTLAIKLFTAIKETSKDIKSKVGEKVIFLYSNVKHANARQKVNGEKCQENLLMKSYDVAKKSSSKTETVKNSINSKN